MAISAEAVNVLEEEDDNIKSILLKYIDETPGIRYRELLRLTALSNGTLTYHLKMLEDSNCVRVDRHQRRMTRYYAVNVPIEESEVIGYIRSDTTRQIILFILKHDLCTFNEIVEYTKKAPSTVSWHLKRLRNARIILSIIQKEYHLYRVINRELVADVLYKYKESFVDKVVNNYTEIIEEL